MNSSGENHLFSTETDSLSDIGEGKNLAYAELVPLNKRFDGLDSPQSTPTINPSRTPFAKRAQVASKRPNPQSQAASQLQHVQDATHTSLHGDIYPTSQSLGKLDP